MGISLTYTIEDNIRSIFVEGLEERQYFLHVRKIIKDAQGYRKGTEVLFSKEVTKEQLFKELEKLDP